MQEIYIQSRLWVKFVIPIKDNFSPKKDKCNTMDTKHFN